MNEHASNLAVSVRQRLLNISRARNMDFNLLLARFACERLLYRLAQSSYVSRFVLKGAMLLQVWLPDMNRPTRDLDLLGFGELSDTNLHRIFVDICRQPVMADGVHFLADTVRVSPIREQDEYGGHRVTIEGRLGSARLHVQVDVGVGDSVTPPAEWIDYPVLTDLPQPRLRAYRPETAIAEKLHTMVRLDMQNSRMKDFFDVWRLAEERAFVGDMLVGAVRSTFERRQTVIPDSTPVALTPLFAGDSVKTQQWSAFLNRNNLQQVPRDFPAVVERVAQFLGPVLEAARLATAFPQTWRPGGPWTPSLDR